MLAHIFQEPEKLLIWNNEINLESEGLNLDPVFYIETWLWDLTWPKGFGFEDTSLIDNWREHLVPWPENQSNSIVRDLT